MSIMVDLHDYDISWVICLWNGENPNWGISEASAA